MIVMAALKYIMLLLFLMLSPLSFATSHESLKANELDELKTIEWVTDSWKGYTAEKQGLYVDILKHAFSNRDVHMTFAPWKRSLHLVSTGKKDITGASSVTEGFHIAKYPITQQPLSVLHRKDIVITDKYSLKNYTGVWVIDFTDEIIQAGAMPYIVGDAVSSREATLKLLLSNKVDYVIDIKNMLEYGKYKLKLKEQFQINDVGYIKLHMLFSPNDKGLHIKQAFDLGMERMINAGTLKAIYSKHNLLRYYPLSY